MRIDAGYSNGPVRRMTTGGERGDSVRWDGRRLRSAPLVLIASFPCMPDREQHDVMPVEVIQDDISSVSEGDDPFTEAGWHLFDRAAKLRLSLQDADAAPNCLNSAFRCIEAGRCEKVPEPRDIEES